MKALTNEEILLRLPSIKGWEIRFDKLHRDLKFNDFKEAFQFMTRVAELAEKLNHHPEWQNTYNRVSIDLVTHDANGISEKDFEFAAEIDRICGL